MINEVLMQFRHKLINSKHLNGKKCKPNLGTNEKDQSIYDWYEWEESFLHVFLKEKPS
jgi:hypothetical protein